VKGSKKEKGFMKNSKILAFGFAVLNISLIVTGCGKAGVGGYYQLNETFAGSLPGCQQQQFNGQQAQQQQQSQQILMTLTDSSGTVTGSVPSNGCFSESFNGINTGNGQIAGVTVTLTMAQPNYYSGANQPNSNQAPNQTPNPTATQQAPQNMTCTYLGNLTLNDSTVSGTLQSSGVAQVQGQFFNACPSSVSIQGTLIKNN